MGKRIDLTDEQIAAIADAAGLDGSELAAAVYQANANTADDEPQTGPQTAPESPQAPEPASVVRPAARFDADAWIRAQAS